MNGTTNYLGNKSNDSSNTESRIRTCGLVSVVMGAVWVGVEGKVVVRLVVEVAVEVVVEVVVVVEVLVEVEVI